MVPINTQFHVIYTVYIEFLVFFKKKILEIGKNLTASSTSSFTKSQLTTPISTLG